MKRFLKILGRIFPLIPAAMVIGVMMFPSSCANTTSQPSGGKKDTIPPVIVGIRPLPGSTHVPLNTQIEIEFDEYVTVKDMKGIFLSPPQQNAPKYRMKGKKLVVYFEEPLLENTTYTLDLNAAVADNNEGNMFPGFTLAFSTGERIDSMVLTGTVRDCNTLQPIKGATVMLYKDHSDSAAMLHRPDAAVKTDSWGYFSIRNIQDTLYRVYAVVDEAGNNIYDLEADRIGFVDSLVRPVLVVSDTLKELLKYDMLDTAKCMARRSEYEMVVFKERPTRQIIKDSKRIDARSAYVSFMASGAEIDSIWVKNVPSRNLIMQFNRERDSLELWINDRRKAPDTLHVYVDYMKTDSTRSLSPFTEHLRLVSEKKESTSKSSRKNLKHEDTTCVFKLSAEAELIEQEGFSLLFNYPLIKEGFSKISLTSVNPRQQENPVKFSVTRDSTNLRKYIIKPQEALQHGYDYIIKVPYREFRDINGHYNDSTQVKVRLPEDDKLSLLSLELSGVEHTYIIDLLNEKRDKVLRSYHIDSDTTLDFPYLKKGKYSIRMTEDRNSNGLVDTGSILEHRQPEKVIFFKLKDGSYVLDIPESTELVQQINLATLFE